MTEPVFETCARCIMRTADDPELGLVDRVCRHCRRYDALVSARVIAGPEGLVKAGEWISRMREAGRKRRYDCVIGISGGVDSSYLAMYLVDNGVRPLAVHVDNGWNSPIADDNMRKLVAATGIAVVTLECGTPAFFDLQRSFLEASTPDVEIPSDHAIQAALWSAARENGVRYIVSGMNFLTESISVPTWSYGHSDWRYIRDVHAKYGTASLRGYPHYTLGDLARFSTVHGIRIVSLLNYIDYDKAHAMRDLEQQFGWTPYGGKHYESLYTRYMQGYLLPQKFGVDKRRGHLSDLVNAGALTRDSALREVQRNDYLDDMRIADELEVKGRLGYSDAAWQRMLDAPVRSFRDFKNSYDRVQVLRGAVDRLRKRGWYPR